MKISNDFIIHKDISSPEVLAYAEELFEYFSNQDWEHVYGISEITNEEAICAMQNALQRIPEKNRKELYISVENGDCTDDVVELIRNAMYDIVRQVFVSNPEVAPDFIAKAHYYPKINVSRDEIKVVLYINDSLVIDTILQNFFYAFTIFYEKIYFWIIK